ncbi:MULTISPECIES: Wzx-type polysaccharide biosynthesis protein UppX [Agrobacterium]|nr:MULTISPECIES: Wzx-type polysaccharide biosynthesis protein UppX [Agrobacterium]MCW8282588.1 lipopolysaccharide biosynthesis protein [Agrobacterium sp. InxBP2]QKJ89937.1 lipopolysaccharide biosynthesis protein [Agrobacterium pusense]WFN86375.1 Wzx-type polysaccharide biosynthesis protein UppX [Agrobacterium pusense]
MPEKTENEVSLNTPRLGHLVRLGLAYMASGGALLMSSAAQLLTFALLARHLGVEQFALYASITAVTNLGVQICGIGSQESLIRRVAQDRGMFPVMLGHSYLLSAATGVVLTLIGMVTIPVFFPTSETLLHTLITTFLILFTNLVLLKVISLSTQSFIAHSDFASANKLEVMFAIARTIAAVVACLVFKVETVEAWALWNLAAHTIAAVISVKAIGRLGRPVFRIVREEIRIGILFSTQFLFKAVRGNADILVLGAIASAEVLGSYSIARRILDSSYLSVEALNRLIYPGSASAALQGISKTIERAYNVLKAALFIATGSALAIFIIAPFLPLLFGDEYVSLPTITRVLCWAVLPMAVAATALEALGASGRQDIRAKIWNSGNLIGSVVVAFFTWSFSISGTIGSYFIVETAIAAAVWVALLRLRRSEEAFAAVK